METIEIYFNKELSDITFDIEALDEWTKTCEELGMSKQLKLKSGKQNSPVPYPYINATMLRVFETVCPMKELYLDYSKTAIPLQVLQQIAFTIREKHFAKIEIWYDDKSPDPLVVGYTGKWGFFKEFKDESGKNIFFKEYQDAKAFAEQNNTSPYLYEEDKYLIAKWGAENIAFNDLKEVARNRFIDEYGAKMKADIETLQTKLKSLTQNSYLYINGDMSLTEATTTSKW